MADKITRGSGSGASVLFVLSAPEEHERPSGGFDVGVRVSTSKSEVLWVGIE